MTHHRFAFPLLILGAVCIGSAPIFVRLADCGLAAIGFWRMLLSLPIFAWWWYRDHQQHPGEPFNPRDWRPYAAGACFAGDLLFWHWGVALSSVANATFLSNLAPVIVVIAAWFIFHERFRPVFFAALALALGGSLMLMQSTATVQSAATESALRGDLLAAASAFFYAGYQLSIKQARTALSTPALMTISGATCALVMLICALIGGETILPQSTTGWAAILGLVLLTQVGGQGLITYAAAHLPAGLSSISLLVQPVVASAAAWVLFGEAFTQWQWFGGTAIIIAVLLAKRSVIPAAQGHS